MFSELLGLRQVVHLRARVVDIRDVAPGETVSYGATWTASRPSRIATITAGYADGYRRHLSNRGEVLVGGVRCPVAGRVTMDMIMVDVTGVPCEVGDVATLLGADGTDCLSTEQVAAAAELSPYELLVGLALRVPLRPMPPLAPPRT
jgi:alanine racemase